MKKRIVLLLSVGLMAAWLWGCGGQEAEEPQEPAAEGTTEEEEAEPVERRDGRSRRGDRPGGGACRRYQTGRNHHRLPGKAGRLGGNQEIFRRGQPVSHGVLPDHGHCERRAG